MKTLWRGTCGNARCVIHWTKSIAIKNNRYCIKGGVIRLTHAKDLFRSPNAPTHTQNPCRSHDLPVNRKKIKKHMRSRKKSLRKTPVVCAMKEFQTPIRREFKPAPKSSSNTKEPEKDIWGTPQYCKWCRMRFRISTGLDGLKYDESTNKQATE